MYKIDRRGGGHKSFSRKLPKKNKQKYYIIFKAQTNKNFRYDLTLISKKMEKFTVDLDAVLDEFEFHEGQVS